MKKLLYLLLLTPIILLTSCSSGGDGPSYEKLIIGSWGLNGMDMDLRYFEYVPNGGTETLLDTTLSLNGTEIIDILGYIATRTYYEDGTYQTDQFDGNSTESFIGTWSITSKKITYDGDDGPYPLSINNNNDLSIELGDLLQNNGDGTWMEIKNGVEYYQRVNGIIQNSQNFKKTTPNRSSLQNIYNLKDVMIKYNCD